MTRTITHSLFILCMIALPGLTSTISTGEKSQEKSEIINPVPDHVAAALKAGDDLPQSKGFMARRRAEIKSDRYYPIYHYANKPNKLHDPNGFCVKDGVYHLFYQSRPYWAHAYNKGGILAA